MVMTRPARATVPALVLPDEQTWVMNGEDPSALGADATTDLRLVRRVLVAERLPGALEEPTRAFLADVSEDAVVDRRWIGSPDSGVIDPKPTSPVDRPHDGHDHPAHDPHTAHHEHAGHDEHAAHGEHAGHGAHGHGGHDHHDMMAIVGEPSADGLVMEPIELAYGPVGTVLPAGLVAEVELDGDVVARSRITSVLTPADPPIDPLAPLAWHAVLEAAGELRSATSPAHRTRWLRVAGVELERALSHVAATRAVGRLVGWAQLIDDTVAVARELLAARPHVLDGLDGVDGVDIAEDGAESVLIGMVRAERRIDELTARVTESRSLRRRLEGLAVVGPDDVREQGLRGPIARASGVARDARADDPLYALLDFGPVGDEAGDALARARLRTAEAAESTRLAARAFARALESTLADAPAPLRAPIVVEGPRGPLLAQANNGRWTYEAPGAGPAREAAEAAMEGQEWADALTALISFDLSPWAGARDE